MCASSESRHAVSSENRPQPEGAVDNREVYPSSESWPPISNEIRRAEPRVRTHHVRGLIPSARPGGEIRRSRSLSPVSTRTLPERTVMGSALSAGLRRSAEPDDGKVLALGEEADVKLEPCSTPSANQHAGRGARRTPGPTRSRLERGARQVVSQPALGGHRGTAGRELVLVSQHLAVQVHPTSS